MSSVHRKVAPKLVRSREPFGAVGPRADMRLLASVCAHMRLEVIGSGEFALADFTLEGTDASMLAAVSSQLVRAGESLSTTLVIANVRLFSGMLPDVHLQVRQLQVALGATGIETHKWLALLLRFDRVLRLLTNEIARLLRHVGSHVRNDKSRVGRHGHLDRSGTLELVGIGRHARELIRRRLCVGVVAHDRLVDWGRVRRGGRVGRWEMLQRTSRCHVQTDIGRGGNWRWKLGILRLMHRLHGMGNQDLWSRNGLAAVRRRGVDRRVVHGLVIRDGGTGVHWVGRRGELLVLQMEGGGDVEQIGTSFIH